MKKSLLLVSTLLSTIFFSLTTLAASTPEFGIDLENVNSEGKMVIDVGQGEEATSKLTLSNLDGTRNINIQLSLNEDARVAEKVLSKNWIKFATDKLTMAPGESKKIEYTVSIPSDTALGTYGGAVTATMTSYSNESVKSEMKSGVAAEVKVLFASAANIKVNVVKPTGKAKIDSGTASSDGKAASSSGFDVKSFFTDNWPWILAVIAILIAAKFALAGKNTDKKGKK